MNNQIEDELMDKIQIVVIDWEFSGHSKTALKKLKRLLKENKNERNNKDN